MLQKLLKDTNLDKYSGEFENIKLIETVVRKTNQHLVLKLEAENFLKPQIIDEFENALDSFFSGTKVVVDLKVLSKLNTEIVNSYFKYFASCLGFSSNVVNILVNRELRIDKETREVRLVVNNHFEFELVKDQLHLVEERLNRYGIDLDFGCFEETKHYDLRAEEKEIQITARKQLEMKEKQSNTSDVKVIVDNVDLLYGKKIGRVTHKIKFLETDMSNVCVEGEIFSVDSFVTRNNKVIVTLMITDYTYSATAKMFLDKNDKNLQRILDLKGKYVKMEGHVIYDTYARGDIIRINALTLEKPNKVYDNSEDKRVELHIHTMMSNVDSVIDPSNLVNFALDNNYEAIGIVDHNSVQSFPTIYNMTKKTDLKVLYGAEFNVVDSEIKLMFNNVKNEILTFNDTYVVFDFETTGLNPFGDDRIIEVGAVKICQGEIIDKFDELCNPGFSIGQTTTDITGIKNSMLLGKRSDKEVVKDFIDWIGDLPIVAQNAEFDFDFLSMAASLYGYKQITNTVLDTLTISRALHPEWGRHGLAALTKKYKVVLDNHHRACDDAMATAKVFAYQLLEIKDKGIENVSDVNSLVDLSDVHKFAKPFHITVFVKNQVGLKNLFKLISLCSTKYFHKEPRILRSEIEKHREGLLISSSCVNGEIFKDAQKLSDIQLARKMEFYDIIEVQPVEVYSHLILTEEFENEIKLQLVIKKIVDVAVNNGKIVIASGDVHHLTKQDKILREIIINNPAPGGGFHPLKHSKITTLPSMHFRNTKEMLEDFSFLGEDLCEKIVLTNPKKVVAMTDNIQIIRDDLYTPKLEDSAIKTEKMVYDNAREIYGNSLPSIVQSRIDKELKSITGHGFDVIYLISSQLVKKSLEDGYLVGSRGSVGSSLVATFMDITEINPLSPHYICDYCKYSEFVDDDKYACGYDLPNKTCPNCNNELRGEGHDIPFETFLGFDGDKVPDIDLNFSGEYQSRAHDYTKVLFGEEFVYRAGTISTIAEKTAFGYVKGFETDKGLSFNNAELTRLSSKCIGVKRSTGQHPGGILVVPDYMDIYDFTPIQYPADDTSSSWYTTHFDFHAIHDNILKLDILGHDDPTVLHMLSRISGIDSKRVDFTKPEVVGIFSSASPLGVEPYTFELNDGKNYSIFNTGTLGVPEFGTRFVIEMLRDTKPKTFAELVKISGLSHGTDVWLNNGQYLIQNNICEFREIIGCRDDIMVYLMHKGLPQGSAFKIMEDVRKGKGLTEEYVELMKKHDVPEWYINSCNKIKYMFPKAHASAYVLMAMRIAYFKVFQPIYYYCAYFSIRCSDFDIMTMVRGKEAILERIEDILNKGNEATSKEKSVQNTLEVALEMIERGYYFENINLDTSHANEFIVKGNGLIPPFNSIDGLGENVAKNLMEQRDERPFMSIEDLKKRGKVNKTLLTKLELMDVLEHLPEGDQLTLF